MNVTQLHTICKEVTKSVFEGFKIKIDNPIFPLDSDVISIEIADMKQTIGQKVLSKVMDNNYTDAQMKVLNEILKSYEDLAVKVGLNYARKAALKL